MNNARPDAGDFIHTLRARFSLEQAFLIALVGRRDAGRRRLLELWSAQVDWCKFREIASPELFAYLAHALAEAGLSSRCPASLLEQLHNRRRFTTAQWLRWRLELRHIIRVFRDQGIDLILLKGAVLTATAYPDTSLRSMSDIDLLVRPADAERALRLIEAAGFFCPDESQYIRPLQSMTDGSITADTELSLPLQKKGTRAFVEVHTQLESAAPRYPASIDELWSRAEVLDLCGLPCKTLDRNEFLLHLIMHLSEHHLFEHGLRALLDVHLWIELHHRRLDWTWIAAEATRRGFAPWVYLTLRMARDALVSPVPDSVFFGLGAPSHLDDMEWLAYEQILAQRAVVDVPVVLILALSQPSRWSALRVILRRIMPSPAAMSTVIVRGGSQPQLSRVQRLLRGALSDLRTRVPKYYRAWRAGRMRWSSLRQAAGLARRADRLRHLMQGGPPRRHRRVTGAV